MDPIAMDRMETNNKRKRWYFTACGVICIIILVIVFFMYATASRLGKKRETCEVVGDERKSESGNTVNSPVVESIKLDPISEAIIRLKDPKTKKLFSNSEWSHQNYVKHAEDFQKNIAKWIDSQRIFYTKEYQTDEHINKFLDPKSSKYEECKKLYKGDMNHLFHGQYGEELALLKNYFMGREKGLYLEVGAYRPVEYSNSYFFDHCLGWEGICVEGNPTNQKEWKGSGRNCKLVKKCVSDKKETIGMKDDASMTTFGEGEIKVECDTLEAILLEAGINRDTKVDFMSIDIEGFEEKVLMSFDIENWNIEVLIVEFLFNTLKLMYYLEDKGYHKVHTPHYNFMFVKGIPPVPYTLNSFKKERPRYVTLGDCVNGEYDHYRG